MFYTDVIMFTQMCFESLIMVDFLGPATWQAAVIWKVNLYNIYLQQLFQQACEFSLFLSFSLFWKWFIWSLYLTLFSFWGFKSFHNKSLPFNSFLKITQVHTGQYLGLLRWKGVALPALSHLPVN